MKYFPSDCHIGDGGPIDEFNVKAHPEIFEAMSRFLNEGNSIFYVWGNHDYPLRFGNVNESLAQKILKLTRDRTDYNSIPKINITSTPQAGWTSPSLTARDGWAFITANALTSA
jgi:predicted MPP superfamily phosphohydrolase